MSGSQESDTDGGSSAASAIGSRTSLGSSLRSSMDSESEANDSVDFGGAEDGTDVSPEFKAKFDQVKATYLQTKNQYLSIQRKFFDQFKDYGIEDAGASGMSDYQRRYQEALENLDVRRAESEARKQQLESELQALKDHYTRVETEKQAKIDEFQKLREKTAQESIMQRTNKPIRQQDLNSKEAALTQKDNELEKYRISFISAKNKNKATQDELDQQDQLSEGLHLIDFEQLKIENQSLNEKKAEKNQETVKIQQKIETNCHKLTHVKEKLAFVRKQKAELVIRQKKMDDDYAESRSKLALARIRRDKVRDDNSNLKKSSGLIGMTDLLYDFEKRSNELELMQDRVTELKTRYNDLLAMQHELEAKIAQRQPLDQSLLRMNR